MKHFRHAVCCLLVLLCLSVFVNAEVPNQISYQGRLTDSEGSAVVDSTYNLNFQMFEHDPPPMGENPLWESGLVPVQVTNGTFVHYLGSVTPLPASIFNDDNLDSYFIRVQVEGTLLASTGIQMVAVPFAIRAATADTAQYAHVSPGGSGEGGWVDDGAVVHLTTGSDQVGIGTSAPTDKLVVGGNLGTSIDDTYIVVRNVTETYSGYRLGFNNDNFGWMRWYSYDGFISFGTRQTGSNYLNTMVLNNGNVGIGQTLPNERLVVGNDLGSYSGHRIVVGDNAPADYTGFMTGEDGDNRAFMIWNIDENFFGIGIEDEGTQWSNLIKLENGLVAIGTGSGNSSVQLPSSAISSAEILNEAGIRSVDRTSTYNLPSVWADLMSSTCDFPSSGYAFVVATVEVKFFKGSPVLSLEFTIADGTGVGPHAYFFNEGNDSDLGPETSLKTLTIHEVFPVTAGVENFYFKVRGGSDNHAYQSYDARMTVLFFPTVYSVKNESHSSGVTDSIDDIDQPILFTSDDIATDADLQHSAKSTYSSVESKLRHLEAENAELRRRLEVLEELVGK